MRVAFPENQPSALPATRRNPMPTASLGERLLGVGKIDIGASTPGFDQRLKRR